MNGPGHYRRAEEILERIARSELAADEAASEAALAQVHATLALTAATLVDVGYTTTAEVEAWTRVTA